MPYQVRSWFLEPHSTYEHGTLIEDYVTLEAAQVRQRELDQDPRRFTWVRDDNWTHYLRDGRIIARGRMTP
jgi:hypothetical protein